MTVSNTVTKKTYTGNGTATSWPIPFSYTDASQVKVALTDVASESTTYLSSGYAIDTGGTNVIYPISGTPLTNATQVTVYRSTALLQNTDYTNQGGFYPQSVEQSLDALTMIAQEQEEEIARSVQLPINQVGGGIDLLNSIYTAEAAAQTSANNSAASATASQTSATQSANSATAAQTFASNASSSANQAATSAASAAFMAYGLGSTAVAFSGDYNGQTVTGYYQSAGAGQAHAPNTTEAFYLDVVESSANNVTQFATGIISGSMYARNCVSGTWSSWLQTVRTTTSIRQTVLAGAVDTNGQANQLAIGTGLSVNELATVKPTITTWANGFDSYGAVDYIQYITADIIGAWSGLTPNSTLYFYKERNPSTGVVTYGFSTLVPMYQGFAPSSPATNQYWFDTTNFVGQYWSGSAWVLVQRVFIGECATGASTVTSVISYQYKGQYDSGEFSVSVATLYIKNHNLGLSPSMVQIDGYLKSSSQYRKLNNVNAPASNGYVGGDIMWQEQNSIKVQVATHLYHTIMNTNSTANSFPNNDITGGFIKLTAKRIF